MNLDTITLRACVAIGIATVATACGGATVIDQGTGGSGDGGSPTAATSTGTAGGGGAPTTTSSNVSTTDVTSPEAVSASAVSVVSATSGPVEFCTSPDECAPDELCIFGTGECLKACDIDACDACGAGFVCQPCATSSCAGCKDCRSACVPAPPGACDDDDGCPDGQACNFRTGQCRGLCLGGEVVCTEPGTQCSGCQSGSCCGCDDCVALCIPDE